MIYIRLKSTDNTLAPYPGSKSKIIDRYVDFLPDDFAEFRDCFVGMGSLTFAIRKRYPNMPGWINDKDEKLITLWRVLQNQVEDLMDFLWAIHREHGQGDIRLYQRLLEWYDYSTNPTEVAASVLLKTRLVRGGPRKTWGYAESRVANNDGLTPWRIMRLAGFSRLTQGLRITCSDYHEPLEAPGTDVLQLLDSPYELVGKKLYEHGEIDLDELARAVSESPHKCLVMLNDSANTRNLFRRYDPIIHPVKYTGGRVVPEIIVPTYTTGRMDIYVRRHGVRLSVQESREAENDNIATPVEPSAPTKEANTQVLRAETPTSPVAANDEAVTVEVSKVFTANDNAPRKSSRKTAGKPRKAEVMFSSQTDQWFTPHWLLNVLYHVFGIERFDLDPCSPPEEIAHTRAAKRFSVEMGQDGLAEGWMGDIVFMNPPYGRQIGRWLRKARHEVGCGNAKLVIGLVPTRTETHWWQDHIAPHAGQFMIKGRLAFGDGTKKAPFASALVFWGDHGAFKDAITTQVGDLLKNFPTLDGYYVGPSVKLSTPKPGNDNTSGGSGSEQVLAGNGVTSDQAEGIVPPMAEADGTQLVDTSETIPAVPIIEHRVSETTTVFHGDCVEGMRRHVPDNSVDLIVGDPPYAINGDAFDQHYHRDHGKVVDGYVEVPADQYPDFCQAWIGEAERVLRPGGSLYVVSGWNHLRHVENALANTGLELVNHIVWHYRWATYTKRKFVCSHVHILYGVKPPLTKRVFNPNCRFSDIKESFQDRYDVWQIPRQYRTGQTRNQNQLPEALVEKMIAYSSNPGDVVLDPFLGGFTTATVGVRMGRRVIGFEKNPNAVAAFLPTLKRMVGEADNDNLPVVDAAEVA